MYSQRNEEAVILDYFKDAPTGRFLDIGAYDGRTFSNVLALAERGWSGVLVEPSPHTFPALLSNYPDESRFTHVNALVGSGPNEIVPFHLSQDAVSSIDPVHRDKWESVVKFRTVLMPQVSVKALLSAVGIEFDFVSVDTESTSAVIAEKMLICGCRPQLICIEHDAQWEVMKSIANEHGYTEISRTEENILLRRNE